MVTERFFLICYQRFLRESALPLLTITRIRFLLVTLLEQLWSQSTCQPQSTRNIFPNRYFFTVPMSFSLQFLGKIWIDTSHSWTLRCFISITVNMKKMFSYSTDPRMAFWLTLERELGRHNDYDIPVKKSGLLYSDSRLFSWLKFMFRAKKGHFIKSSSVFWV